MIPTVADFESAVVEDTFDDMVSPPGLTNHWATVQVDHDVLAIRSLNVPPLSHGDTVTGRLYLDGRLAQSFGAPVRTSWRPDRVLRETTIDGIRIETTTVCPPEVAGVVVRVTVTNTGAARELRLGVWVQSTLTRAEHAWLAAEPPSEPNSLTRVGGLRWGSPHSGTPVCLQGLTDDAGEPVEDVSGDDRLIETVLPLAPGASWSGSYVHVVGDDREAVAATLARVATGSEAAIASAEQAWNTELEAVFTPGNDLYSGSLPELDTSDEALRRLYWWGVLGVIWFRRDNPASVLGRTYDTLMPRYWQTTTFIWDYSLSSFVHAQLDPAVMRRQIAHWVGLDINAHFGTEWLTGGPVGYWYSVNQYALIRLVADYVRFTGDIDFLAQTIEGPDGTRRTLGEHVRDWALAWQDRRTPSGLADYGGIDNLLECVSTYVHEVASLQAANVWAMRTAADLRTLQGFTDEAIHLREQAEELLPKVLKLYRPGDGFFDARYPDGSRHATRHCYDFATVGTTIAGDLTPDQCREMVDFFVRELRTPSWMRALSPRDVDAGFSLRPDHQWNGAYPAWPADSARAAIALGGVDEVLAWLPGLARTTLQGPPGQAHFVEEAARPVAGGARKAPGQYPYLIDWACSSAGAWCELVIGSIFGVEVGVDGTIGSGGVIATLDPDARLSNLVVRGQRLTLSAPDVVMP